MNIKMEIVKTAVRVGNSAGVLLPKKWLDARVRIVLEPLNIEKEALEILAEEGVLSNILGIYITGSYARGEQSIDSDVDILAITGSINKKIRKGRYEIILISQENAEKQLENNSLPLLPMIKEAKAIMNSLLIEDYANTPLTEKNLKWYIKTAKERIKEIKKDIGFYKKAGENCMSDSVAYILILRLRSLYIIDSIKKNKIWKKAGFLRLVREISGSLNAYGGYLRSKNNERARKELPLDDAERIADYIGRGVAKLEKWLAERKG